MTLEKEPHTTVRSDLVPPINLQSVEKPQLLFYLSGQVPLTVSEFTTACKQRERDVEQILNKEFQWEIRIDSTKSIQLTDAARRPIIHVGNSFVESAKKLFENGKSLRNKEEYTQAAEQFRQAASILRSVCNRFEAVHYEPKRASQLLADAKKHHNSISKETAEHSVVSSHREEKQNESVGDQRQRTSGSRERQLHSNSDEQRPKSQGTPLKEKLIQEIQSLTKTLNKVPSAGEMQEKGAFDAHQYFNMFGTWKDAVAASNVDLQSDLLDNLRSVAEKLDKRPTTVEVDEYGRYSTNRYQQYFDTWQDTLDAAGIERTTDEEMLAEIHRLDVKLNKLPLTPDMRDHGLYSGKRYRDRFGSWDTALEKAGIDKEERLIEELHRVAKKVEGRPTTTQMNTIGKYSSSFYSNEFGSWGDAIDAADIESVLKSGSSKRKSEEPHSTSSTLNSELDNGRELTPSAFENSWETIPDNNRLDGQLLIRVDNIKISIDEKTTHVLSVSDRNGTTVSLNIWKAHSVDIDWEDKNWYAVSNLRGTVWENDAGEKRKRLSSTKDLGVVPLGSNFAPKKAKTESGETHSKQNKKRDRPQMKTNSPTETGEKQSTTRTEEDSSSSEDTDEESILNDIMADFGEM